jgi:hypothetical protein
MSMDGKLAILKIPRFLPLQPSMLTDRQERERKRNMYVPARGLSQRRDGQSPEEQIS